MDFSQEFQGAEASGELANDNLLVNGIALRGNKTLQTDDIILKIEIHKTALKPPHTIPFRAPVCGERDKDNKNIPLRALVRTVFSSATVL